MAGRTSKKPVTLTQALAQFLAKTLLPDLKERAKHPAVNAALTRQWEAEKAASRTADGFGAWEQRTLEQVGAAWVLSCVFVRTLEDRDLLARRRLAGPGAADNEQLFFELAPSLTARDYLLTVFKEVASLPGAEELLGPRHNPVWRLAPSNEKARALLDFFRQTDDQGRLSWRFEGTDTRFLGDLYQDLSEEVRKRYALLQTPDFVERFILDQTLDPAITEFGLEEVRVIDPTCGSGHFLLGAFDRLLTRRLQAAPGVDVRDHASAALAQVYGVDVNPYAVAIARFRLTLAYLQRTGITKLAQAPRLPLNLVVADSLLHGAKNATMQFAEHELAGGNYEAWDAQMFALDDPRGARKVFGQRYHAVVGNPPYITCKDKALRDAYRELYKACHREYALAAPFTERFFQLAVEGGFVGLINSNSFMKREFGKALIEQVLPKVELTRVLDTSGAYIPGHGTPTVILVGRNRAPVSETVDAVLGKRGEPTTLEDPEQGYVWRSIADHYSNVGFENEYISVARVPRSTFLKHPWSLGGGGAAHLKAVLEGRADLRLGALVELIGFGAVTREDDVFLLPAKGKERFRIADEAISGYGFGEAVRDWSIDDIPEVLFPYDRTGATLPAEALGDYFKVLWRYRTQLWLRQGKGFKTKREQGGLFYEYSMFYPDRHFAPFKIAFAFVATHNHFVLDRGGKVFNRSAPIIKLPESATEDDHLALLAYLNSSTACFWMKQVFQPKHSAEHKTHPEPERNRYEHAGTGLQQIPVPKGLLGDTFLIRAARLLDDLARKRAGAVSSSVPEGVVGQALRMPAWHQADEIREQMIALQEEIDWRVYSLFGLYDWGEHDIIGGASCPRGARPSELLEPRRSMVRRRDHLVPLNQAEIPPIQPLSPPLMNEWTRRKEAISRSPWLAQIERPLFKRQWRDTDDNVDEYSYRRDMELRIASEALASDAELLAKRAPNTISVRAVLNELRLLNDGADAALYQVESRSIIAAEVLLAHAFPAFSAEALTESGLRVLADWRHTWSLQRREDLGESVGEIPVPPKYDSKDYRDPNYWRLRGKLDVPKERFISYPGCEKDGDPSPLIGWAGWNHLQRAQALVALYQERKNDDGWPRERLMPMLVGLHELMFWLDLWHTHPEAGSQNPAREFNQFLNAELQAHHLTPDDLGAWRPPSRKRRSTGAAPDEVFLRPEKSPGQPTRTSKPSRRTAGVPPFTNEDL